MQRNNNSITWNPGELIYEIGSIPEEAYLIVEGYVNIETQDQFKLNTLGFSQGGPTLVRWLMSNKLNTNSLILWGSDIPKDSLVIENKSRWNSMNLKIVIGKNDEYINEEKKQEFVGVVKSYGLKYDLIEYEGSHKIIEEELKKIANSL